MGPARAPDATVPGPALFVALGDSLTEGIGDPLPDRSLRGWATLVGAGLAVACGTRTVNLGLRGATADSVLATQLQTALDLRPDLASVVVGVNDVMLAGRFSPERFAADLGACVRPLRAAGATVLLARLHDPALPLRLPRRLAEPLRRRVAQVNAAVDAVAAATGALVLDLGGRPDLMDGIWSLDRLHPNERGHRLVAREALDVLVAAGVVPAGVPLPEAVGAGRRGQARWLAADGIPWFAVLYAGRARDGLVARLPRRLPGLPQRPGTAPGDPG